MSVSDWIVKLIADVKATPLPEWLGAGFGVVEVLLAKANSILLYPAGIISVVISSYIFFNAGLYAESILNAYYLIMSIYWVDDLGKKRWSAAGSYLPRQRSRLDCNTCHIAC